MSRDILGDDLIPDKPCGDSEHYEPGCDMYSPELIAELIQTVLTDEVQENYLSASEYYNMTDFFTHLVEKCTPLLEPVVTPDFHHNTFLDCVVSELSKSSSKMELARMTTLFSPLIQTLYNLGGNDFYLNTSLIGETPYTMLCYISGTENNPLALRYVGDTHRFGDFTEYCHFDVCGTVEAQAATRSKFSEFVFHDAKARVGGFAHQCSFYVPSHLNIADRMPQPSESNYYLPYRLTEDEAEWLDDLRVTSSFFRWKNKIYVPQEDNPSDWEEVSL